MLQMRADVVCVLRISSIQGNVSMFGDYRGCISCLSLCMCINDSVNFMPIFRIIVKKRYILLVMSKKGWEVVASEKTLLWV